MSNTTFFKFNHGIPNLPSAVKAFIDTKKMMDLSKFNINSKTDESNIINVGQKSE